MLFTRRLKSWLANPQISTDVESTDKKNQSENYLPIWIKDLKPLWPQYETYACQKDILEMTVLMKFLPQSYDRDLEDGQM